MHIKKIDIEVLRKKKRNNSRRTNRKWKGNMELVYEDVAGNVIGQATSENWEAALNLPIKPETEYEIAMDNDKSVLGELT